MIGKIIMTNAIQLTFSDKDELKLNNKPVSLEDLIAMVQVNEFNTIEQINISSVNEQKEEETIAVDKKYIYKYYLSKDKISFAYTEKECDINEDN